MGGHRPEPEWDTWVCYPTEAPGLGAPLEPSTPCYSTSTRCNQMKCMFLLWAIQDLSRAVLREWPSRLWAENEVETIAATVANRNSGDSGVASVEVRL